MELQTNRLKQWEKESHLNFLSLKLNTVAEVYNTACQCNALCKQQLCTCTEYNFKNIIRNWQFNWPFGLPSVSEQFFCRRRRMKELHAVPITKAIFEARTKIIPLYSKSLRFYQRYNTFMYSITCQYFTKTSILKVFI